mmetsp:Transcript_40312/g.74612  ORF Transcript_40312/g.74612 Transcript_40312/m.74612 type:complete len:207 (-) Transcript_40312:580-1200(-)
MGISSRRQRRLNRRVISPNENECFASTATASRTNLVIALDRAWRSANVLVRLRRPCLAVFSWPFGLVWLGSASSASVSLVFLFFVRCILVWSLGLARLRSAPLGSLVRSSLPRMPSRSLASALLVSCSIARLVRLCSRTSASIARVAPLLDCSAAFVEFVRLLACALRSVVIRPTLHGRSSIYTTAYISAHLTWRNDGVQHRRPDS